MGESRKLSFLSLCSGCGGMDLGLERAGFECQGQVEIMPYALKVLSRHWKKVPKHTDILTLLRSDSLARIYQTQTQKEKVLKAKEVISSLSVCGLSTSSILRGYSGMDSHRGIVIGNAVTVQVAEWIGKRIVEYERRKNVS